MGRANQPLFVDSRLLLDHPFVGLFAVRCLLLFEGSKFVESFSQIELRVRPIVCIAIRPPELQSVET
jgi:hypothetical protein